MSIHPVESPAVCLVSIEESVTLTVASATVAVWLLLLLLFFLFGSSDWTSANLRNRTTFSHQTSHTYIDPYPTYRAPDIFRALIRITILDLEPNPCFQTFLNISETNDRIFNWNISKRSSGQELPFIFFELRAPTCL